MGVQDSTWFHKVVHGCTKFYMVVHGFKRMHSLDNFQRDNSGGIIGDFSGSDSLKVKGFE